jgi:hypothetical protein
MKNGYDDVIAQVESVLLEHNLDVEAPTGAEWMELYSRWRASLEVETTVEPPEGTAHKVVDMVLDDFDRAWAFDNYDAWVQQTASGQGPPRFLVGVKDGRFDTTTAYFPAHTIRRTAEREEVDFSDVVDILRSRGIATTRVTPANGKRSSSKLFPSDARMQVLPVSVDFLTTEGYLSVGDVMSEVPE